MELWKWIGSNWQAVVTSVAAIVNIVVAIRLTKVTQSFEREKLSLGRGDVLFRRQIEAIDYLSKSVAEPITLGATLSWDGKDGVVSNDELDFSETVSSYVFGANNHYWPLGLEMSNQIDGMIGEGWLIVANIMGAKTKEEFEAKRENMMKHRTSCFEVLDEFLSKRIGEATSGTKKAKQFSKAFALESIELALPFTRVVLKKEQNEKDGGEAK